MKEYAAHWQLALLGAEFWNDVETRNQPIHDLIDTVHDQTLHTRFPFNLVSEENSRARSLTAGAGAGSAGDRAPSPDVVDSNNTSSDSSDKPRRRRRYSMSDVFTRSTAFNTPELTLTMAGSRKAERAKRSRSESRTRSQEQQTPQQQQQPPQPFSRSSSTASNRNNQSTASLLRSALQRLSRKRMGSGEEQMPTPVNSETAAAGEVGHRSHPQPQQQAQQVQQAQAQAQSLPIVFFTAEQATPTNPLLEFRGGATWARFPRNRRSLGIDVYLPIDKSQSATATTAAADSTAQTEKQTNGEEEEEEEDEDEEEVEERVEVLPVEQLFPLIHFRHLRSLKITGMVQSYQRYIWQAAWLNTGLEELELSMVCPPRLRQSFAGNWPYIKGGWTMNPTHYSAPVYYGTGAGALPRTIGEGEYLDKIALEKAKICAMVQGPTRNRLSIRTLTLTGFVVDADPFLLWFDATRLKCLHFKDYCVDAGFYLCEAMHRVSVLYPQLLLVDEEGREAVVARRVNLRKELKVVQLRGGRKVGEMASTGPGCLDRKIPEAVGVGVGGAGQEEEEEEGAEGADAAAAAAPAPASATE
ncbi:uncharacterized protein BO72DRAFT_110213 [Aspergillus fijiensis CBS 313.89]|uniref:Uncharacterized protein n=1 Tax=Aspergillus fijiensis CBS 313.89 TaxID=1448319 RepID=A0A8G1RQZ2_9EURO|nr:uncharacterized protein BO72DRAFT_110213 [Aspergillus fijiensis CBS 313.89]RAK77067.1 hypothetical protein BO72DRAFT_110213 [Aspergillus fijiensis CBS 313.89]